MYFELECILTINSLHTNYGDRRSFFLQRLHSSHGDRRIDRRTSILALEWSKNTMTSFTTTSLDVCLGQVGFD